VPYRGNTPSGASVDPFDSLRSLRIRIAAKMKPLQSFALTPGKRVLFLTKDPELIRVQFLTITLVGIATMAAL